MSTEEHRRAAAALISWGAAVIPVPAGSKNPGRAGWERLRISEEEIHDNWTNGQNVGLLCGEPSGWRVDVDLDADEAVRIAGRFLPPTLTGGRDSRPHSHWWFIAPGAESCDWKDTDGKKLVELRSTGRQTIVAPSTHPDGDKYVWHLGLEMAEITADDLAARCRELATASLIARHVPLEGSRHDYALAVAGFLLRPGRLDEDLTLKFSKAAWHAAGADAREALRDLEGIVRDTAARIEAGEPVVGGPTLEEVAPGIVRLLSKWWGWERKSGSESGDAEEDERKPTQAENLIRCADGADLSHTPAGDSYATVPVNDHRETHPVKAKGFRRWIVRAYFEKYGRPPGNQALQDALGLLEARADFDGPEREVYVRVAEHGGNVYIDLADEGWRVVEITPAGWRVVDSEAAPVRFRRPRGMLALPTPHSGDGGDGCDGLLQRFFNVDRDEDLRLIVAWLVAALRPTGPYPVLLFQGEQGSAKSTAERLVRALVDPSAAPLRTTPRSEHDLFIAADNAHVVALDNISVLQPWLSDALCRLSTGGGFSTRTLYENREEELFDGMKPVILNGITDVATRPDLLDRALVVSLPPIPDEERRSEAELWREFGEARPAILAALFDAVAGALRSAGSVRLEGMPRMADFAVWATAAEESLGWEPGTFMAAYVGNRQEAADTALDADPVAGAVLELMSDREEWTGTASELWTALGELVEEGVRHTKAWPGAPNALTGRLKRLAPTLRGIGIEYGEDRSGRARKKLLAKKKPVKDRHDRHHRHNEEFSAKESQMRGDGPGDGLSVSDGPHRHGDDPAHKDRHTEKPIYKPNTANGDGDDSYDDDSRPYSKAGSEDIRKLFEDPPGWLRNQARICREQGAPERLIKPLAASVATHLYEDHGRAEEIMPAVGAQFHPLDCECAECL